MALASNLQDLATRIGTEFKTVRTELANTAGTLSSLNTTAKSNLVAAINELAGAIGGSGATIDDENVSTLTVYSSEKTVEEIEAAVSALVESAPELLDTLAELAAALGDDPEFATTVTGLIGAKADDSAVVKLSGNQTISDVKTFSTAPVVPDGAFGIAKVSGLSSALSDKFTTADATESAKGIVELATTDEVTTGTDTARAVTAAGVRAVTGDGTTDFVETFENALD